MSRYEWERGTIIIPAGEWVTFRKTIIKAHNDALERDLADALTALAAMKAAAKGKRGPARLAAEKEALARFCGLVLRHGDYEGDEARTDRFHRLSRLLFEGSELRTPKKKDLNLLPLTGDASFACSGGSIRLENATRTVTWSVSENNHAIESARAHPLAKLLFSLLAKIEWTRGSGGTIVGNDEYNRDSDREGGGSNYVTQEFSAEASKRAREAASRSYSGGYGSFGRRW